VLRARLSDSFVSEALGGADGAGERKEATVETIVERPAALDVHKAQVTACARVPGGAVGVSSTSRSFATTVRGLLALRDWLAGHGVTQVVMEATGVYWKAPWAILETSLTACWSTPATSSRSGPQDDVADAAWLCQLAEAGLLKSRTTPRTKGRGIWNTRGDLRE
jgi:hypothetical protein